MEDFWHEKPRISMCLIFYETLLFGCFWTKIELLIQCVETETKTATIALTPLLSNGPFGNCLTSRRLARLKVLQIQNGVERKVKATQFV